jgi:hypothetical protein
MRAAKLARLCYLISAALLFSVGAGRSSGYPVVKPLGGTFLHPCSINANWCVTDWENEFNAMEAVGCSLLVVQFVAYDSVAIYPSSLPWLHPASQDPVESLLTAADRTALQVQMGSYWSRQFGISYDSSFLWNLADTVIAVQNDLYQRYHQHQSLAGWYLVHEAANARFQFSILGLFAGFYNLQAAWCHDSTHLPCSVAPYFDSTSSFWMTPESTGLFWRGVLAQSGIDILMLQDGVGCHRFRFDPDRQCYDHVREYFQQVKMACDSQVPPRAFWADVEIFSMDRENSAILWPSDIDTIAVQLQMEQDLAQKMVAFEFHQFMSPWQGPWPASVYREYQALLHGRTNQALGRPDTCSRPCSPQFPDLGQLTDGQKSDQDTALVGWSGTEPVDIDVPLAAPCSVAAIKCFFRNGPDSLTRPPDSVQFFSVTADTALFFGTAIAFDSHPGLRKVVLTFMPELVMNRIRVRVFPQCLEGELTLMSEIEVTGKEAENGIEAPAYQSPQPLWQLAANPCGDWLELRLSAATSRTKTVTVYDAAGRRADGFIVAPGVNSARLDISRLSAGIYFLRTDAVPGIGAKFVKER